MKKEILNKKDKVVDFTCGPVVNNQCKGHRFDNWSGKIPHDMEQLSSCATTTEPTCPKY